MGTSPTTRIVYFNFLSVLALRLRVVSCFLLRRFGLRCTDFVCTVPLEAIRSHTRTDEGRPTWRSSSTGESRRELRQGRPPATESNDDEKKRKKEKVLAFPRRRARDFKLLVQIRHVVALCLARGLRIHVRWIPSEFNAADEGSRIHDVNKSKSLTHFLGRVDAVSRSVAAAPSADSVYSHAELGGRPYNTSDGHHEAEVAASENVNNHNDIGLVVPQLLP